MGQALWCYNCCWLAQCQCIGVSASLFCCNCWLCIPKEVETFRGNECLKCGGCGYGYGGTFFLCGEYLCVPDWLRLYSIRTSVGEHRGPLGDVEIISRAQPADGYAAQTNQHMGRR